jgi:Fe-S cluster biogenesis protein NfuA
MRTGSRSTEDIIKDIKVLDLKLHLLLLRNGRINFLSYEKGIVRLQIAGSCSRMCNVKNYFQRGVERLLKHYVPEVQVYW